jgi:hypothetical protein
MSPITDPGSALPDTTISSAGSATVAFWGARRPCACAARQQQDCRQGGGAQQPGQGGGKADHRARYAVFARAMGRRLASGM